MLIRLERGKIKDEIQALRISAKNQRLDKIERLEAVNILERRKVEDKIKIFKDSAKGKRLDRIIKLTEASKIAHSMGIKDPIDYKLKKISDLSNTNSQIMTDVSSNTNTLYSRGYEALEAEITSLTQRTNDEPFIKELRGLEDKLKLLEHSQKIEQLNNRTNDAPFIAELREKENTLTYLSMIKIDPENIKVAHVDQAAFPSKNKTQTQINCSFRTNAGTNNSFFQKPKT
ncbi:MAG: hypothetical protein GY829_11280 [Gammaproteobacteria bacterium]|nr:hypothetical protein [Gammaproteobacteria bacterium]